MPPRTQVQSRSSPAEKPVGGHRLAVPRSPCAGWALAAAAAPTGHRPQWEEGGVLLAETAWTGTWSAEEGRALAWPAP